MNGSIVDAICIANENLREDVEKKLKVVKIVAGGPATKKREDVIFELFE